MEKKSRSLLTEQTPLGKRLRTGLFLIVSYFIILFISIAALSPERYDVKVGDVSPATITAAKDIVDELTTERRRKSAEDAVSPVYYKDESVSEIVISDINSCFSELRAVRALGEQIRLNWADSNNSYTEDNFTKASELLTMLNLSSYQLRTLMNTSEDDLESLYQTLLSAVRTMLLSSINEGQINDAISSIQQIVSYNTRTDLWYNVAIPTLRACLRANMLIDQVATEENRQKARDAVDPTTYKQGQNIVVKGDRITEVQYAVLQSLGVLEGEKIDYIMYVAGAAITALIMATCFLLVVLYAREMLDSMMNAMALMLCLIITMVLCLLTGTKLGVWAMPTVLLPLLLVNLLGIKPAYIGNLMLTLMMTFLTVQSADLDTSQTLSILLICTVGGTFAIFIMKQSATRIFVVLTGILTGIVNAMILSCVTLLTSDDKSGILTNASYEVLVSLLSAIVCIGLQPIMESAFNLVTPSKLIELSNPNQPLLRRLMIETPGTYHHSMVVANLAEAAAEVVGANALLVRVGAYYHDIGKLVRPIYFKENQLGDNPHDRTDPKVSAAILTEHTQDGADLARKHRLPEPIIEMIQQHHGDTPVMYFYAKAIELYGEEKVDIQDFRYVGPKPQSAEAAILMLSDTVEAAVRAMREPTKEKISGLIEKLVRGKMEDGQLDECTLTFRDIGKIRQSFENSLQGVFHQRIEYPDVKVKSQRATEAGNK